MKKWFKGLATAAITGAATGATAVLSSGDTTSAATLKTAGTVAGIAAIGSVLAFLQRSPLPPDAADDTKKPEDK